MVRIARVVPLALLALGCAASAQTMGQVQPRGPIVDTRPTPFDERTTLPMDLTSACERAAAAGQRVLVIWGRNGSERTARLVSAVNLPDNLKLLSLDYQVLWVNVGEGPSAARNLELASVFGVETSKDAEHASMSIHGPDCLPIARTGVEAFGAPDRPSSYSPLKFQDFITAHKPSQPTAQQLVDEAAAKAKAANKAVLVRFYELGDEWGERFETLMALPEVAKIVSAHTVPVRAHVQRNAGTMELLGKHIPRAESYPLYVLLDAEGKALAMSQPEGQANIGYPTDEQEIARFVALLSAGPSKLTSEEAARLGAAIRSQRPAPAAASSPAPAPGPASTTPAARP